MNEKPITIEFNKETSWILGRPNFWCGSFAPTLRKLGLQIPEKAEAEQAAVIFWLLSLYAEHGENYKQAAEKILKSAKAGD